MVRLVIAKEKEDSPVPLDLAFEKGEKAVVSDVADVAKEDQIFGCLSQMDGSRGGRLETI
jgi:hypothetical protein